ncbi:MAG: hypothetical protein KU37_08860 [Sulfuricurvum sp. PC08-66]|nr:MAG: hypothetical protein KU37_08860 [Sulfuricurvum sp. PC08-66]
MRAFEDVLSRIDAYYEGKTTKDKIYSYILAGAVFLFLSYTFLFDYSYKLYEKAQEKRSVIIEDIENDQEYLQSYTQEQVEALIHETEALKKSFATIKEESDYIDYRLRTLSLLMYDTQAWSTFLDTVASIARTHNVHVSSLQNSFMNASSEFGHVLNLDIVLEGDFKNLVRFIDDLERTHLVVDITQLSIEGSAPLLKSTLQLAVWGISY